MACAICHWCLIKKNLQNSSDFAGHAKHLMFTTSHRFSSSLRLLTNFNNINSHDILIERLWFRFLRSPLIAYVIVLHDYWCCVDKLLMCVYSVTSVAYFWSETLTVCFISVAMFNNWFCVGVDPDGMLGRKPSVPKDELQDFFTKLQGGSKNSRLLILSEHVNNTEKPGGTWTNKNSCRENEALPDIFRWNIFTAQLFYV